MDTQPDTIHVDGGFKTNQLYMVEMPRGQGYAKVNHSPTERIEINLPTQNNTSQEAEFFAIICGITECIRTKKKIICTDSKFCYEAITEKWQLKEPRLKLICSAARALLSHYQLEIRWLQREENMAT